MEEDCTHEHCIIRVEQKAQEKEIVLYIMWGSLACFLVCLICSFVLVHRGTKRKERAINGLV
jgi:hypothetical protein